MLILITVYWLAQIHVPQNIKQFIRNAEAVNHAEVQYGIFIELECSN